jgi:hypothetical protein
MSSPRHAHNREDDTAQGTSTTILEVLAPRSAQHPGTELDPAERSRRIAEAAYYRAQQRGFCPGCELDDWLEAERLFDEQCRGMAHPPEE